MWDYCAIQHLGNQYALYNRVTRQREQFGTKAEMQSLADEKNGVEKKPRKEAKRKYA
jgi:hypothetical protein